MGIFDEVKVLSKCPYCKDLRLFYFQTKDLKSFCFTYSALPSDWGKEEFLGKKFREKMPVYPAFPLDKSHVVWSSQAERIEAKATIPDELLPGNVKKRGYITGCAICESYKCVNWAKKNKDKAVFGGRIFYGKIKLVNKNMLISPIYDVEVKK